MRDSWRCPRSPDELGRRLHKLRYATVLKLYAIEELLTVFIHIKVHYFDHREECERPNITYVKVLTDQNACPINYVK